MIWDVFLKYEAVNYSEDGKVAFYNAIHYAEYLNMPTVFGAFDGEKMIGIIASRNEGAHIALFFVDGNYHRKGIGRKLMEILLADTKATKITVHSSLFAKEVYEKLGFIELGTIQEEGEIQYIPMV